MSAKSAGRVWWKSAADTPPDRSHPTPARLRTAAAILEHGPCRLARLAVLSGVPVAEVLAAVDGCDLFVLAGGRWELTPKGRAAVRPGDDEG